MNKHVMAAMFVVLFASQAFAALPPVSASIGYASEVFTSSDYDLVDGDDHLPMWHFGAGYSLRPARGVLDLELQFHTGATGEAAYQSLQTSLWLRGVEAGATWRYPLYKHLEPYARLGAGYDWATLSLGGERLEQTIGRPAANGTLGLQIPLPLRPDVENYSALVVDFGVGYTLRPAYGFHELAPRAPDEPGEDPIAHVPTNLGSLSLSGVAYRILLTFRL
jgi:hypothetical protein